MSNQPLFEVLGNSWLYIILLYRFCSCLVVCSFHKWSCLNYC